jgi:UDP-N-acetylmuramoyl-L-alanyl-D-glutamate--2,6-diaminopimelate ligase
MLRGCWSKIRHGRLGERLRSLIPHWVVNNFVHLPVAAFSVAFYRYPARKLKVVGVTGTDGKTTTATLIHKILVDAGKKAALISTVSAKIGNEEIETGLHVTSPDPWQLQKLLRHIVGKGFEYLVLEATSHGLAQNRLFGCNFIIGVVTNITHEHLDYHGTYQNYLEAKAKLFKNVRIAVLNRDDESYGKLRVKIQRYKDIKIVSYGIKKRADFNPKNFPFRTKLPGEYNRYNCLATIAATSALGISESKIRESIADFKGVKGRMEEINLGQDFKAIVDFAHTPNALENVLQTLKSQLSPRPYPLNPKLIVVFGCAGLRDVGKRPMMGEIAARLADLIVLTAEDPRTEDVNKIIGQIAVGCRRKRAKERNLNNIYHLSKGAYFFRVPDRGEAINFAISKLAHKGDIVVVCGKGHEQSMCYGTVERPWSDQKQIKAALARRLKNG